MSNGYWIERIEITFWNFSISLMQRSRIVQTLVVLVFALIQPKTSVSRPVKVVFLVLAGLLIGLSFGFLIAWLG
jgi:hypothetical protein